MGQVAERYVNYVNPTPAAGLTHSHPVGWVASGVLWAGSGCSRVCSGRDWNLHLYYDLLLRCFFCSAPPTPAPRFRLPLLVSHSLPPQLGAAASHMYEFRLP